MDFQQFRYKGFIVKVGFCARTTVYYAEILNLEHLIAVQTESLNSIKTFMVEAIEQYLDTVRVNTSLQGTPHVMETTF